jgi:hypothetical protein
LRLVSDTVRLLGSALPSFATRWLDAYAHDPAWFLAILAVVILLTTVGSRLAGKIKDEMRRIWVDHLPGANRSAVGTAQASLSFGTILSSIWPGLVFVFGVYLVFYPVIVSHLQRLSVPGHVGEALSAYTSPPVTCVLGLLLIATYLPRSSVRKLREWPVYQWLLKTLKYNVTPFVSAFGLLFVTLELGAHYTFNFFDSLGRFARRRWMHRIMGFMASRGIV